MKKVTLIILIVVIAVLLVCGIIFIIEYNKVQKNTRILGEGLELLKQGKYAEGLSKCDQMSHRGGICYTALLGYKISDNNMYKNGTITKEFCDSIPVDDNEPFWYPNKQKYKDQMQETKNNCYTYVIK